MSEQTQICTNCKIEKSLENYYFRKDRNKHETQCKLCVEEQITNFNESNYNKQFKESSRVQTSRNFSKRNYSIIINTNNGR